MTFSPTFVFRLQALRYMGPPDHLLKQLSVYTEEKFEDEEDLRERSLLQAGRLVPPPHAREISESQEAFSDLMELAKEEAHVYPILVDTLRQYTQILRHKENE